MTDTFWVGTGQPGAATPSPDMEYVVIPPDVTIRTYTPASLSYGDRAEPWNAQIGWCEGELDWTDPIPNDIELHWDPALTDAEFAKLFCGNVVLGPGMPGVPNPVRLCSGDRDSCPVDQVDVMHGKSAHL